MNGPVHVDGDGRSDPPAETDAADTAISHGAPIDRHAALAEGAPGIPARFVWWVLGGALLLTLGGVLGEHLFSAAGLNPTATTTTTAPNPTGVAPQDGPAPPSLNRTLSAALPSFMSLTTLSPRPVTGFTLTDQSGQSVTVPPNPARVVVLTFFDAPCNDICPVLASEMEQADSDLGAQASDVEFLTVNSDPNALGVSTAAPALGATGLQALTNWHLVTGTLATLNSVWKDYGVSISVNAKTGLEAHSDVMVFIDRDGFIRYRATPFADENSDGTYSLSAAAEARWGLGIATYAKRLIGQ